MLINEFYRTREDGVKLYRTYSDSEMMIRKDATDELYTEAIDVEDSDFTYTETDIPVVDTEEPTLQDAVSLLSELGVNTDDNEA